MVDLVYICPRCGLAYHFVEGLETYVSKEKLLAVKLSGKYRAMNCKKCEEELGYLEEAGAFVTP